MTGSQQKKLKTSTLLLVLVIITASVAIVAAASLIWTTNSFNVNPRPAQYVLDVSGTPKDLPSGMYVNDMQNFTITVSNIGNADYMPNYSNGGHLQMSVTGTNATEAPFQWNWQWFSAKWSNGTTATEPNGSPLQWDGSGQAQLPEIPAGDSVTYVIGFTPTTLATNVVVQAQGQP